MCGGCDVYHPHLFYSTRCSVLDDDGARVEEEEGGGSFFAFAPVPAPPPPPTAFFFFLAVTVEKMAFPGVAINFLFLSERRHFGGAVKRAGT